MSERDESDIHFQNEMDSCLDYPLDAFETIKVNENSSLEDIAKIFAQLDGQSRLIVEPWRKEAELLLESRQVLKRLEYQRLFCLRRVQ